MEVGEVKIACDHRCDKKALSDIRYTPFYCAIVKEMIVNFLKVLFSGIDRFIGKYRSFRDRKKFDPHDLKMPDFSGTNAAVLCITHNKQV